MIEQKMLSYGSFSCHLVDRVLQGQEAIHEITRNGTASCKRRLKEYDNSYTQLREDLILLNKLLTDRSLKSKVILLLPVFALLLSTLSCSGKTAVKDFDTGDNEAAALEAKVKKG